MKTKTIILALTLYFGFSANAQLINPVKSTKTKVEDRTNRKTDELIDKGLDKLENGIDNLFNNNKNNQSNNSNTNTGNTNQNNNYHSNNSPVNSSQNYQQNNPQTQTTDFSQYKGSSFIPGKHVLFFEDFATARLGSGNGNWHFYEYDPSDDVERPNIKTISSANGKWLKMPRKGFVFPNSFKNLPEQFTIEFDLYADPQKMSEMEGGFSTVFIAKDDREEYSIYWSTESAISLDVHPHGNSPMVNILAKTEYNSNLNYDEMVLFDKTYKSGWNIGQVNRVSIYRNGSQVILYLNGKEVLNLPNGLPKKAQYNLILSTNLWGDGMYFTNFRVARDIPNATQDIKSEGKFVTNTIYFDVNSSRIKPESWASLNNAAQAIKSTTGQILIVGHTDSDGNEDANLNLSIDRANAIKNALVKDFGIDPSRLVTDGKGETQPLNKNSTPSEKAQNRRVEFIKL